MSNQTADTNAADADVAFVVTTPPPSVPPTGLPTDAPPEPPDPWYRDAGLCCEPHMIMNTCLIFFFVNIFAWVSSKCWKEYKHDAKKIYAEGPYYRRVAAAAVRETAVEAISTPGYVRDATKEWWKMIVQPNEIDARPWPGRVASERRVCEDGYLQG